LIFIRYGVSDKLASTIPTSIYVIPAFLFSVIPAKAGIQRTETRHAMSRTWRDVTNEPSCKRNGTVSPLSRGRRRRKAKPAA
jgi:hypothetical protein